MLPLKAWSQAPTTVKQQMEQMHQQRGINFVYDATINLEKPYRGPALKSMSLEKALKQLFEGIDIQWQVRGNYVMLRPTSHHAAPPSPKKKKRHTLSGFVRDQAGETLINATVYDLSTQQGTTTNEHGYFSLTLNEGIHRLRVSYVGFNDHIEEVQLSANRSLNVTLSENARLNEVEITGDLNSPLLTTQTGKRSLSATDIQTEFSLLSSPDVVKTLQRTSGVTEGLELASGLYVHGGNSDENLFLIDGTPLYQINHSLGLFSSFNADVVKNVDFYKSGFPARYGGRLSSVVDVRTQDGNMQKIHGSYRIGLLDGSIHLEGPLQKDKTSFNIGLRRSWIDLLMRPAFAILSRTMEDQDVKLSYFFHDLNAKVTHVVNDHSRVSFSLYSGSDKLSGQGKYYWIYDEPDTYDLTKEKFSWGNLNAALDWNWRITPQLQANFTGVYTHNRAHFKTREDNIYTQTSDGVWHSMHNEHATTSKIDDIGYRTAFDFRPNPHHHIRFGHDYTFHLFRPQTNMRLNYADQDTLSTASSNKHRAHEVTAYAEDQITLSDHWTVNGGLHFSLFATNGKTFSHLDPRLALKYQLNPRTSLKASYTQMTQYVHKISNSFLELPTDYWVPTTERLHPMHSHQLAAGIYMQPHRHWTLSIEGYWKATKHLLQHISWNGIEPPAGQWDQRMIDGEGRFYGLEFDARYHNKRLQVEGSYTLSWNKRKFEQFYSDWYYDKFDNRHKLNVEARWDISPKIRAFAAWTYHTGNHLTFATQYAEMPISPGYRQGGSEEEFFYEKPNNITLPAYHRLDVGFDFHHTTKHGHERIWNLSLYNAYCHLNSLWVETKYNYETKKWYIKNHAYIPIIPSFSYTIKF